MIWVQKHFRHQKLAKSKMCILANEFLCLSPPKIIIIFLSSQYTAICPSLARGLYPLILPYTTSGILNLTLLVFFKLFNLD